jgi:hypothetical protein
VTKTAIYLVSTPLHFLIASSIALRQRERQRAHLVFIDQQNLTAHPYLECESRWSDSPFVSRYIFPGRQKRVTDKIRTRKAIFRQLAQLAKELAPEEIYVGNDRRIEFQYAMHEAARYKSVTGIYMDEGTFTYVGRQDSGSFSDRVIDNTLKKLTYGFWWTNPPTVGASSWISEAYVAFPELVHPLLRGKRLHPLTSDYFMVDEFKQLARIIVEHFKVDPERLAQLDVLLTLPHESVMEKVPGYAERMRHLVTTLSARDKTIGVKYHPRNHDPDALRLGNYSGVWLIPDGAAYETFLPLLGSCLVVGDMSTTLLTTRWLRSDLRAVAVRNAESIYFEQFQTLFQRLGIDVLSPDEVSLSALNE